MQFLEEEISIKVGKCANSKVVDLGFFRSFSCKWTLFRIHDRLREFSVGISSSFNLLNAIQPTCFEKESSRIGWMAVKFLFVFFFLSLWLKPEVFVCGDRWVKRNFVWRLSESLVQYNCAPLSRFSLFFFQLLHYLFVSVDRHIDKTENWNIFFERIQ